MSVLRLAKVLTAITLAALAQPAAAQTINSGNNRLIEQNQIIQLRNSLQRQQYQQQQQLYREQDRQIVPQQRPEVPVVRQSCPVRIVGSQIVRVCR